MVEKYEKVQSIETNDIKEKTIFHLNNAHIDKVVLLPVNMKENQEVKKWVEFAPDTFIPFYNAPEKANNNIDVKTEIKKAIVEDGYKGFKVMLTFREKKLNDPLIHPVLEAAQRYKLPIVMHCGYPPPGTRKNVLTYSNPIYVDEFASSYPRANIIITHMGYPFTDIAIALAAQYPNVYLDLSNLAYMMPVRLKELLIRAKEMIGVHKILFGSDGNSPEMIEIAVDYFDNAEFLKKEEIEKIMGLNAVKLLKL
ncbi:MAG: amidohydrolase family protein [Promethearchaeota archaeon]|jgi:predicted TIM-barrel fold metal-dependent hydrolase